MLNLVLVYGVGGSGLGIAGSALGTLLAQVGLGRSRWSGWWSGPPAASGAPLRPDLPGIRQAGRAGVPLICAR